MSSVAKSSGAGKKAARDRRILATAREEDRAENPVSDDIERAAKRAGIEAAPPTVDAALDAEEAAETAQTKTAYAAAGIPFAAHPRSDEELARERLRRMEKKVLASTESDSLRSRIMRILSAGAYVDDASCTPERALLRYAAATSKAAGLALMGAAYVTSNENFEMEFTEEDAAIVMCGLSEMLETAPDLLDSIAFADVQNKRAGGAS